MTAVTVPTPQIIQNVLTCAAGSANFPPINMPGLSSTMAAMFLASLEPWVTIINIIKPVIPPRNVGAAVQDLISQINDLASNLPTTLVTLILQRFGLEKYITFVKMALEQANIPISTITSIVQSIIPTTIERLIAFVTGLLSDVSDIPNKIKSLGDSIVSAVVGPAMAVIGNAREKISALMSGLSQFKQALSTISLVLTLPFMALKTLLSELPSMLPSIVVNAFASLNGLFDTVKAAMMAIVGQAAGILGIPLNVIDKFVKLFTCLIDTAKIELGHIFDASIPELGDRISTLVNDVTNIATNLPSQALLLSPAMLLALIPAATIPSMPQMPSVETPVIPPVSVPNIPPIPQANIPTVDVSSYFSNASQMPNVDANSLVSYEMPALESLKKTDLTYITSKINDANQRLSGLQQQIAGAAGVANDQIASAMSLVQQEISDLMSSQTKIVNEQLQKQLNATLASAGAFLPSPPAIPEQIDSVLGRLS